MKISSVFQNIILYYTQWVSKTVENSGLCCIVFEHFLEKGECRLIYVVIVCTKIVQGRNIVGGENLLNLSHPIRFQSFQKLYNAVSVHQPC